MNDMVVLWNSCFHFDKTLYLECTLHVLGTLCRLEETGALFLHAPYKDKKLQVNKLLIVLNTDAHTCQFPTNFPYLFLEDVCIDAMYVAAEEFGVTEMSL